MTQRQNDTLITDTEFQNTHTHTQLTEGKTVESCPSLWCKILSLSMLVYIDLEGCRRWTKMSV